eukprot:3589329-Amphidinium_carterae.1
MSAQLPRVFRDLATKVRVQQPTMTVLAQLRIDCADDFSYRLPSAQAVEEFLAEFTFNHVWRITDALGQASLPRYDRAARDGLAFKTRDRRITWYKKDGTIAIRSLRWQRRQL